MAANSQLPSLPHLINGEFVHSDTRHWRDVVNPATQEVLARVPMAARGKACICQACVQAARSRLLTQQDLASQLLAHVTNHEPGGQRCIHAPQANPVG